MDPLVNTPTNQPLNPTLNDCKINSTDQLSSSDYHSFSSNDASEYNNYRPESCQINSPSCSDDSSASNMKHVDPLISDHQPPLLPIIKPQGDKAFHATSSVPFKWEEAPGKPIPTSSAQLEMVGGYSDKPPTASPLQLPPKLHPQAHHSLLLLQSPCRFHDCVVDRSPATINHQYHSPQTMQPISQTRPSRHSLWPLHQSSPFAEFSAFPESPYLLQQKLKKVCTSFLRSASWSKQPLHKLAPPCGPFACHGSSPIDDAEEEEEVTSYDRFFFDATSHKDFNHNASAIANSQKPTWSSFDHASERQSLALPIFDKSHREEDFVSRDALRLLAMEDSDAESNASFSPWRPIIVHERRGSGSLSWPPASIMSPHDTDDDDDEGFHDFFSPSSSRHAMSQRIEDAETSACLTPLPWFLDFGPIEEEKNHVVNKASSKMSLVRLLALIKLKSTISSKVCKPKRKGGRDGALYAQDKSMWSPTLATYFYDNLHKEAVMKLESTPTPHYVSEDEQSSAEEEGPLRINYHLPSMIKGKLIANHSRLDVDDDLVSPQHVNSPPATSSCSSCVSSHDEKNPKKSIESLSSREQLAQLNAGFLCSKQTRDLLADDSLKETDHDRACKGICKLRRTVQMLATSIKMIATKFDDKKKEAKRPPMHHCSSLKTIFPLSSSQR